MNMLMKYNIICCIAIIAFLFGNQHAVAQYCIPVYENSCSTGAYVNKFTFNTISNGSSGCNGNANNYILYPESGTTTTAVVVGGTYSLSVKTNNDDGIGIWIDYNNDNDFEDAGEFIYASPFYDNITFTGTVIIPNNVDFIGQRRLRVRGALETLISAEQSCTTFENGETEDYIININPAAPCTAAPASGTITAFPSSICAEGNTSELLLNGFTVASGILIAWEKSMDGNSWNTIDGANEAFYITEPLYSATHFRAKVTCENSGQFTYSNEMKINVGEVKIWSVVHDSVCGAGIADLKVLSNANTVSWYATETSGLPFYSSGSPFLFSPTVTGTTTYYVAGSSGVMYIDSLGLKDNVTGSGSDAYQNDYLVFSTLKACKLTGVHVYPSAEGFVIIQLRDGNFQPIRTDTFTVTASQVNQKTYLELNYNLDPGLGFQITLLEGSVPLWSNQSGVSFPYEIPGVFSLYTSNLGPNYYFYFYNWVVNYTDQCETPRVPVTAYVSTASLLMVNTVPNNATICANNGSAVIMNASPGFSSYSWSPATGLSSVTGEQVAASPLVTTTYTVNATDSICQNQMYVTVTVANTPSVAVTASADSICGGTSSQLFAAATPLMNYLVDEIEFSPETTMGMPVQLGEDELSAHLPLGFSFRFYGSYYNSFRISSNGFITFDANATDGCCEGDALPDILHPNNVIAFAWEDLSPQLGGSISYFVSGTAPFRKLVVRFDSILHYGFNGGSDPVTAQVFLYETSNAIEIHTASMPGNPAEVWLNHTMAIENATGTAGASVPGRNGNNTWTAFEDAWRFKPLEYVYNWSSAATLDNPSVSNPVATPTISTNYILIVTDTNTQCADTSGIIIKLISKPNAGIIDPAFEKICGEGTALLTLNDYTSGSAIQWMHSLNSGGPYEEIPGAISAAYVTPLLDTTGFYVAKVSCTNVAFAEEAFLQVMPVPLPPSGDTAYRCSAGKVELQATASGNGTISWHDAPTGGNYLGQGTGFTTPPLAESTVYWVEEGPSVVAPLPTTFLGGSTGYGNMFDLTASQTVVITGFEGHLSAGNSNNLEIYYKKGTYAGYENDAAAWTLLGSANGITGEGIGLPTPYPIGFNLAIAAGNTYAFYITSKTEGINYTFGTNVGDIFVEDDHIKIAEGIAIAYPFGDAVEPIRWNGIVHYQAIGCASERAPVHAIIHIPLITTSVTAAPVCKGESISITATNNGTGNYNYQWLPLLPSMDPPDGIGSSITITPAANVDLTLTATEINSGCDTVVLIPIQVIVPPIASFSGLPDTAMFADDPYLLTGVPAGGLFEGAGITGNFFDPELAGIGGPYSISYTFTDTTGCIDDTTKQIVVVLETGTHELNDDISISIFPNPTSGQFMIEANSRAIPGQINIVVRDMPGKIIYREEIKLQHGSWSHAVDLSNKAKGIYIVEVHTETMSCQRKITIE